MSTIKIQISGKQGVDKTKIADIIIDKLREEGFTVIPLGEDDGGFNFVMSNDNRLIIGVQTKQI
jgi:CO dehydrogenase nickel-insertion accessory protein CooC1